MQTTGTPAWRCNTGALIFRIGVAFKGSFKRGFIRVSIGLKVGAFIIRIGLWGPLYYN